MKKSIRTGSRGRQSWSRQLAPAIALVSSACGLAAAPAGALELGDIRVESALGQPLRASIAYALGTNEQLSEACIRLDAGLSGAGIPSVTGTRVSLSDGLIVLTGSAAVKDPLLNMRLVVSCPYAPRLQREYTLLLDPHDATDTLVLPAYDRPRQAVPAPAVERLRGTPAPRLTVDRSPIAVGGTYRVQAGDTASSIASRITNRGIAVGSAVRAIVDANPDAFVGGDVNQLVAGSLLAIPDFAATPVPNEAVEAAVDRGLEAPAEPVAEIGPAPSAGDLQAPVESAAETAAETVAGSDEPVTDSSSQPADAVANSSPAGGYTVPVEETAPLGLTITAADELRPGDVVVPPVEPVAAPAVADVPPVEDTDIAQATESNAPETSSAWSWLVWLAVAGLAVIVTLLVRGRNLRDRFAPVSAPVASAPAKKTAEDPQPEAAAVEGVDLNFDELEAAGQMALDADFNDGTGLHDSSEIDVRQDFGFTEEPTMMTEVDFEISEDLAHEPEPQPTDIIPPTHRIDESSILDAEIRGAELTGDYDLSMIIDATKQPIGDDDRTAQDLQAVRVEDQEYLLEDLTLDDDVDLGVLTQDYENEFAASQSLNFEIEKAARFLVEDLEKQTLADTLQQPSVDATINGVTLDFPLDDDTATSATDTDSEMTAMVEMPPTSDLTGITQLTINLPAGIDADNDPTASDTGSHEVIGKAASGSDVTIEMKLESGALDAGSIDDGKDKPGD